jgi:hypothetical protein
MKEGITSKGLVRLFLVLPVHYVFDTPTRLFFLVAKKGFEIGSGFEGSKMTGSEHNDEFYIDDNGQVRAPP